MRGEADAAFRQIETEFPPHRAAEPCIHPAFGRPGPFDQAAEHDAIAVGQARLEQAENAHALSERRWPPNDEIGHQRGE
jgi:hypothetical protein